MAGIGTARGLAEDVEEDAEDGDGLVDLEEASGARRVDEETLVLKRALHAGNLVVDLAVVLERREEEGDLVRIVDLFLVDEAADERGDLGEGIERAGGSGGDDGRSLVRAGSVDHFVLDAVGDAGRPGPAAPVHERRVEVDDALAGAVVARKRDGSGLRRQMGMAPSRELDEVFDGGTAEAIEGLVVVAHDADVFVAGRELEEEALLDGVGVLVLVDDDVLEDTTGAREGGKDVERLLLDEREVGAVGTRLGR